MAVAPNAQLVLDLPQQQDILIAKNVQYNIKVVRVARRRASILNSMLRLLIIAAWSTIIRFILKLTYSMIKSLQEVCLQLEGHPRLPSTFPAEAKPKVHTLISVLQPLSSR